MKDFNVTASGKMTFFVPLTKVDDEQRMVWGYASTEAVDSDGDIVTREAMEGALDGYMKFANIREMHQLSAVGTADEANVDNKGLWLGAKIVDDVAWKKVKTRVYKGFSIGGAATKRDPRDPKKITGLELIEISLVDRPANPEALIEVFKAATAAPARKENKPMSVEDKARELAKAAGHDPDKVVLKSSVGKDVLAWQTFISQAESAVAIETAAAAVEEQKRLAALPKPSRVAKSVFACGMLSHGHDSEEDANKCIVAQDAAGIKNDDLIKRQLLASGIDTLTPDLLTATVADVQKQVKAPADDKKAATIPKPTTLNIDLGSEHETIDEITKAHRDAAEGGDYGTDAEADYADAGFSADKRLRLPLKEKGAYSKTRIEAAHDYMSRPANLKKYSPLMAKAINDNISAAWKAAIDPKGPPSATDDGTTTVKTSKTEDKNVSKEALMKLGKPDAAGNIRKGLWTCCTAISLLEQLNSLTQSLEIEASIEKDGSVLPDRFGQVTEMVGSLVQALLEEEIGEMLSDTSAMEGATFITYAAEPLKLAAKFCDKEGFVERFRKAIGDKTGSPKYKLLSELCDAIEKGEVAQTQAWGDRAGGQQNSNDSWLGKAQTIHDHSVELGAKCTAEKAADTDVTKKKDDTKKDDDMSEADKKKKADDEKKAADDAAALKKAEDDKKADDEKKRLAATPPSTDPAVLATLTELGKAVKELSETVLAGRRNPTPKGGSPRVVEKTADFVPATDGKVVDPNDHEAVRKATLATVLSTPQVISR